MGQKKKNNNNNNVKVLHIKPQFRVHFLLFFTGRKGVGEGRITFDSFYYTPRRNVSLVGVGKTNKVREGVTWKDRWL